MFLLYLDEFGHDGVWDPTNPRFAHHPLFGLAGFAIRAGAWRDLDRGYLRLKKQFYSREIRRGLAGGKRPERFEAKSLSSQRDIRFAGALLDLLKRLEAHAFIEGRRKPVGGPHDSAALYGSVTQGIMRSFERYVRHKVGKSGRGVIILDRRSESSDVQLLFSAQSYLFSAQRDLDGGFDRVVEIPLLVRSEWHHAVQAADTVARVTGRVFRFRLTGDQSCRRFDAALGTKLDVLKVVMGACSSVHVV